jgi:hypothetical protein
LEEGGKDTGKQKGEGKMMGMVSYFEYLLNF